MKVLVCGDRDWSDKVTLEARLSQLQVLPDLSDLTIIEGEAPGADTMARCFAEYHGIKVMKFPADWDRLGRAAGPIRNRQMLDQKPDLVIAFHKDISKSKGTLDTVFEACRRGIPAEIISKGGHPALRNSVKPETDDSVSEMLEDELDKWQNMAPGE